MNEIPSGGLDHTVIAIEQLRRSFIRKRKDTVNNQPSETAYSTAYAEENVETEAEVIISDVGILAKRAVGTVLQPDINKRYAPAPTNKHTPQQAASIRVFARRQQERRAREWERKYRKSDPSIFQDELASQNKTTGMQSTQKDRSYQPGRFYRSGNMTLTTLGRNTEESTDISVIVKSKTISNNTGSLSFRPISFSNDASMPSVNYEKITYEAQEDGRQQFITSHRQRQYARRSMANAKKRRNDLRAIAIKKETALKALTAGGGFLLVLAVFTLLIGAVSGSGFGIFFSAEDVGDDSIRSAMQEINQDYTARVNAIKTSCYYDELELSGTRSGWREVLAVYAVKYAMDATDPIDVVTITPEKREALTDVFWDMNELTSEVKTRIDSMVVESEDEEGHPIEQEIQYTVSILSVHVYGKTPSEMANDYAFTPDQRQQLQELLSPEYSELWSLLLYGVSIADGEIVSVALSQLGNRGGDPYWSWYGFTYRVEWCACFVSWCANELGYIEAGIIPMFSYCPTGAAWFQSRGQWADRNYEPTPGCLIFYDWEGDGELDHVGIVERCEGGIVHTVEGNAGDVCARCAYRVGSGVIAGYGIPEY